MAQAQERFRDYNVWQIGPNVLSLFGLSVTLILLHMGLVGAVLVQVVIQVIMTIWMAWLVNRAAPLHLRWNGELARGMLSFGSKSYVQTLAATLHLRIDQYICAFFLPAAQVGLYSIAVNFGSFLLKIPEATGTVMFPRLAGSADRDAHAATTRVCRYTLFILGVGIAAFAIIGPIAIPFLYGNRYDGAIKPLLILLPGLLMMALYQLLTRNFTSRGKQEINIIAACVALTLNVSLEHLPDPALRHRRRRARQRPVVRHRRPHAAGGVRARLGPLGRRDASRPSRRDRRDRARGAQDGEPPAGQEGRVGARRGGRRSVRGRGTAPSAQRPRRGAPRRP